MLACIFVAGSFFLTDGTDLVNPDQIWHYEVKNDHLTAYAATYQQMSFGLTPEQQDQTALQVVTDCLNNADRVALAQIDDI